VPSEPRGWGPDRWRLYGLVASEAVRALRGSATRTWARLALATRPRPTALLVTPQDLRTSDPTTAADIYGGRFVFAGRALTTGGRSPFDFAPPSPEWGAALYGFGWLRHLRAADDALARANARALVQDYVEGRGERAAARAVPVTARRLISFLAQSPVVLEGADHAFYRRYLKAIAAQVRDLERAARAGLAPQPRLQAAVALAYAGLCCEGLGRTLRRATRLLARELDRQVGADGGHLSRDPHFLAELLLDLLPLRQIFLSRDLEPPPALTRAIDRALPYLRFLRHGDGSLSHFNGAGASAADHLATLLVYDPSVGRAPEPGLRGGYARLAAGPTVLVLDAGGPPPLIHSARAGAGTLSFELTSGAQRVVVNCGLPRSGAEARRAARLTAAHSTATVADTSSSRLLDERGWWGERALARWLAARIGPVLLRGPRQVEVRESGPLGLAARHDGYRRGHGVVHERSLALAPDGRGLDGLDTFTVDGHARAGIAAAIRFHLHPAVRARRDAAGIHLALPGGEAWLFTCADADLGLEDSQFFAAVTGARRTEQIVLHVELSGPAQVAWRFERVEG
jgi:uncharacterized heparinase superfamily protein